MDTQTARECFACHTMRAVFHNQIQADHLIPGVTCEACHGPGAAHVAAVKSPISGTFIFSIRPD